MVFNSLVQTRRFLSSSKLYDVVVVGGGMVGNAMAAALGSSPVMKESNILLLEAGKTQKLSKPSEVFSNRVSAVSPASTNLFKNLNIWDDILKYRVGPVQEMRVMDDCSQSNIFFEPDLSSEVIAHIIENNVIIGCLYNKISKLNNVEVKEEIRVTDIQLPLTIGDLAKIKLSDGSSISTNLVIGADGFNSLVRKAMGTNYTTWNYDQMGIVCTLKINTDGFKNNTAWQRFTPLGPLALLPLNDNFSSLVWTTSTENAKRLLNLNEEDFIKELNYHLQTESKQNSCVNQTLFLFEKFINNLPLGSASEKASLNTNVKIPSVLSLQTDTRAAFPLGFGHAHNYIAPRSVLIGDAAHRMHPLAGQGVNLGWSDVRILVDVIEKLMKEGGDLGSVTYLKEYESKAQKHNLPVMVGVDWLNRLYRTDFTPVVMARSLGLFGVNKLTPLKDFIIHQASH
ncbi:Ubiquinone biosynthesis monooxygenase COQ6 [Strongyloides ratti]|uniref:Ubiquinone biosynthesis monooxygenase COQ6, mitochondrial n=1 Tax=Strongyloides ratti TaxID=34506 RepID=A0A090L147_STRRB|nr:Ubiquinone biosynthesis monooxygenase COQ6 [Strongyloides ratti]CEF63421.1 Ubiquinone biosynthesis monooxygenase COQ6 [Strongyloides ratti]